MKSEVALCWTMSPFIREMTGSSFAGIVCSLAGILSSGILFSGIEVTILPLLPGAPVKSDIEDDVEEGDPKRSFDGGGPPGKSDIREVSHCQRRHKAKALVICQFPWR